MPKCDFFDEKLRELKPIAMIFKFKKGFSKILFTYRSYKVLQ